MQLEDIIAQNVVLSLAELQADTTLLLQIQSKLADLLLYPSGSLLDGIWGPRTEAGLSEFCQAVFLSNMTTGQFGRSFAEALLHCDPTEFLLKRARDRDYLYTHFSDRKRTTGIVYFDHGIDRSLFGAEVVHFTNRLQQKPDGVHLVSSGSEAHPVRPDHPLPFSAYPVLGQMPSIDDQALNFLHPEIEEACVCISSFMNGSIQTRWLGKQALRTAEFWSATKIIPILYVISQVNSRFPTHLIKDCQIRQQGSNSAFAAADLIDDVVTYKQKVGSSNAIAAMFKRFTTHEQLERWTQSITGHNDLGFRGNYGEAPFVQDPELFFPATGDVVLQSASPDPTAPNRPSAYDLTRLVTMLGWHHHIPPAARFPGSQWSSLSTLIQSMGRDTARYVDVALETLGLIHKLELPVILSKLGYGFSGLRQRTEATYTALLQFVDLRPRDQDRPAQLRSIAFTLRGARQTGNLDQESFELDVRMATEITELLRRIVMDELI